MAGETLIAATPAWPGGRKPVSAWHGASSRLSHHDPPGGRATAPGPGLDSWPGRGNGPDWMATGGLSGSGHGPPFLPPRRYFAVGREKRPRKPDFFSVSGLRWPRGQPPMPHPASHAGQMPAARRALPRRTGGQQPVPAASGPGIGVPVSIWPHAPVPGRGPARRAPGRRRARGGGPGPR